MGKKNSIKDMIISSIKTKEIIKAIKKQNGGLLGRDVGETIDKMLDADLGNKKSYQIEKVLVPFIIDFCDGLTEALLEV